MFTVVRGFNNNLVLCVDDHGNERIVLGRGVGYAATAGDTVDPARVQRTYRPDAERGAGRLSALVADLPATDVAVSLEIVDRIGAAFGEAVAERCLLPLTDHLCFTLRRIRDGLEITYPLQWEVETLYPKELAFARDALQLVEERTGVTPPAIEAVPMALHLVNSQLGLPKLSITVDATTVMAAAIERISSTFDVAPAPGSADVARFVAHLRYLLVRSQQGEVPDQAVAEIGRALRASHPREYECAGQICRELERHVRRSLGEDEVVYLTVHVARLVRAGA